jgi:thiamine biosynthesis protein ThiS
MNIQVNGEHKQVADHITVEDLLRINNLDSSKVVVEVNLQIVKRDTFGSCQIHDNDKVEILRFVGGG